MGTFSFSYPGERSRPEDEAAVCSCFETIQHIAKSITVVAKSVSDSVTFKPRNDSNVILDKRFGGKRYIPTNDLGENAISLNSNVSCRILVWLFSSPFDVV